MLTWLSHPNNQDICENLVREMETLGASRSSGTKMSGGSQVANEAKVGQNLSRSDESNETAVDGGAIKQADRGSKKKKGKATGNAAASVSESASDIQEQTSTKSKRSQRRGKDTSSSQISDSKTGSRKESLKTKQDNLGNPSEDWIMQKIVTLVPDFEEQCLLILTSNLFPPIMCHLSSQSVL